VKFTSVIHINTKKFINYQAEVKSFSYCALSYTKVKAIMYSSQTPSHAGTVVPECFKVGHLIEKFSLID